MYVFREARTTSDSKTETFEVRFEPVSSTTSKNVQVGVTY